MKKLFILILSATLFSCSEKVTEQEYAQIEENLFLVVTTPVAYVYDIELPNGRIIRSNTDTFNLSTSTEFVYIDVYLNQPSHVRVDVYRNNLLRRGIVTQCNDEDHYFFNIGLQN